ncbi:hypothetical protein GCM10022236_13140 [Microlunatus ginsengisoli]|uniref:Uncharacterized protein n=1 Tax=Microlunatus ginsengisoli TaxID=363863 RepID=A0ABP6ZMR7_9ACTN
MPGVNAVQVQASDDAIRTLRARHGHTLSPINVGLKRPAGSTGERQINGGRHLRHPRRHQSQDPNLSPPPGITRILVGDSYLNIPRPSSPAAYSANGPLTRRSG